MARWRSPRRTDDTGALSTGAQRTCRRRFAARHSRLGRPALLWYVYKMILNQHLAWVLGAVALIAAFLAPSVAGAHVVHAQAAPVDVTAAPQSGPQFTQATPATVTLFGRVAVVSAAPARAAPLALDCKGHCCSSISSMACCSAALAAEMSAVPIVSGVRTFLLARTGSLPGLAPETLPKPPKSFG
jgi:hypothetical protein